MKTLKTRADFLRVRGGRRWATPALVLEGKARGEGGAEGSRFGFTVAKKLGKAVVRNRVRRRLKAAASALEFATRPDFDYVVIARPPAADRPFAQLKSELETALSRMHRPGPQERARGDAARAGDEGSGPSHRGDGAA